MTQQRLKPVTLVRMLLVVAAILVIVAVIAIGIGASSLWNQKQSASTSTGTVITPATDEENLVIVSPFKRERSDVKSYAVDLANDLRLASDNANQLRVEMPPNRLNEAEVLALFASISPRMVVTGDYNDDDIHVTLYNNPPRYLSYEFSESNGSSILRPFFEPSQYKLYAPQSLGEPLNYLESFIKGQAYFWNGDYEQARNQFLETKQLLPRQVPIEDRAAMDAFAADLNWYLGYLVGPVGGNWQAARDIFGDALSLSSQNPAAALGLAASLAQLNDLNRAADTLRQALRDHPESWQIHFALAEIALQQGDPVAGFANYERAIDLLSVDLRNNERRALADIYFSRGYYLLTHDDPASAFADFQQAFNLGRDDVYLQGNLGWAAYLIGDYETAIRVSSAARQLEPVRPDLAFNEALVLLASGQTEAARVAYDEAIALTLAFDDVLTRSTYFGVAYNDLEELVQRQPDLTTIIRELQERIDIANG